VVTNVSEKLTASIVRIGANEVRKVAGYVEGQQGVTGYRSGPFRARNGRRGGPVGSVSPEKFNYSRTGGRVSFSALSI
jgi:hypothetical protein